MSKISKLITLFGDETQNTTGVDRELYLLLHKYQGVLPEPDENFHKAFRQMDITDDGNVDMQIWKLLHESDIFWKCFIIVA